MDSYSCMTKKEKSTIKRIIQKSVGSERRLLMLVYSDLDKMFNLSLQGPFLDHCSPYKKGYEKLENIYYLCRQVVNSILNFDDELFIKNHYMMLLKEYFDLSFFPVWNEYRECRFADFSHFYPYVQHCKSVRDVLYLAFMQHLSYEIKEENHLQNQLEKIDQNKQLERNPIDVLASHSSLVHLYDKDTLLLAKENLLVELVTKNDSLEYSNHQLEVIQSINLQLMKMDL